MALGKPDIPFILEIGIKMKYLILFATLIISVNAYSLPYVTTTLENVRVTKSGTGYLYLTSNLSTSSCPTPNTLNFDLNTDAGKSILSVSLTAISTNKVVYIEAFDACEISLIQIPKN